MKFTRVGCALWGLGKQGIGEGGSYLEVCGPGRPQEMQAALWALLSAEDTWCNLLLLGVPKENLESSVPGLESYLLLPDVGKPVFLWCQLVSEKFMHNSTLLLPAGLQECRQPVG